MSANIRTIIRNFIPGVAGRGVNQLSSYIDAIFASFLPTGAVAALAYTQTIYLLPVSLFGMSISNAELPEMASHVGSMETIAGPLCKRLNAAMQRIAFFIIPSVAGFLALGDSIIGFLYQTGKFTRNDGIFVWAVLAGYTIGLLAATLGRLYTSAFWALRDTKTPLRFAAVRVVLAAGVGWFLAFPAPRWLGFPAQTGLIGLTAAAGMAAWVEFALLRSSMNRRIGRTGLPSSYAIKLWSLSIGAAAPAFALKYWTSTLSPLISGSLVLAVFGFLYFAGAAALQIPEATKAIEAIHSRLFRKS